MVVGSSHFPVDYTIRQTTEKYVLTSSLPKKGFKSETFLGGSGRPNFMKPFDFSKSLPDKPLKKSPPPWLLDMLKWARANRDNGCKLPQVRFVQIVRSGQIVRFIQTFLSTQNLLLTLSKSSFNILLNFVSLGQYFCIPKLIEL